MKGLISRTLSSLCGGEGITSGWFIALLFWLAVAETGNGATISENFGSDPASRGWRTFGDSSLFGWNGTSQNLEATWDSSRTNSFFYLPLRTILTKADDFSVSFDIRLKDIRTGVSVTKTDTFEIAVGLLNSRTMTNANYFRGAGVSAAYGVRNLVEFDYFPQAGVIEATFAATVVSTNNRFGFAHNFPLEMTAGDLFRITVSYTASNQTVRTSATKNGATFGLSPGNTLGDLALTGVPDFRVDAFGVSSYSDAIQTGTPDYWGSVLAHGMIDNVAITTPAPPLEQVALLISNSLARVTFDSRTNWNYTLQRSPDLAGWNDVSSTTAGRGGPMSLSESNAPPERAFYRVMLERP